MSTASANEPLSYEEERGKPMPSLNHSWVQTNLVVELARHREYRVHSELTLEINGERFTPDISLYPREMPIDLRRDLVRSPYPPLLVVEIFSPQQGTKEVLDKLDVYFPHGVKSCWVVAPPLHTISIYTAEGAERHFNTGAATVPALGISVDVDAVFSWK